MIQCKECGAKIDARVQRCPYCGMINELGAEQQYMQQMDELREDLEELGSVPLQEITGEVHKHLRITGKVIVVTLAAVAILGGIFFVAGRRWEIQEKLFELVYHLRVADVKEQLLWERENFPQLDAWYTEGNLEELLAFYQETTNVESGIVYDMDKWEHTQLIACYEEYWELMEFSDRVEAGEAPALYEYQSAFYRGMCALHAEQLSYRNERMDEQDLEQAAKWREEIRETLKGIYGIEDADLEKLFQEAEYEGYLKYEPLYQYVETIQERLQ